jgi:hypothetical protein
MSSRRSILGTRRGHSLLSNELGQRFVVAIEMVRTRQRFERQRRLVGVELSAQRAFRFVAAVDAGHPHAFRKRRYFRCDRQCIFRKVLQPPPQMEFEVGGALRCHENDRAYALLLRDRQPIDDGGQNIRAHRITGKRHLIFVPFLREVANDRRQIAGRMLMDLSLLATVLYVLIPPQLGIGGGWLRGLTPQAAGMVVFLSGAALILGGSMPIASKRLEFPDDLVPLAVLELSHNVTSAIGVALLILSRGLFRRLRGAYQATIALIVARRSCSTNRSP